MILIIK